MLCEDPPPREVKAGRRASGTERDRIDPYVRCLSRGDEGLTLREKAERMEKLVQATATHQERSKHYLPRVLGNDPCLQVLNLSYSEATDVSVGSLVEALRGNHVITELNLRGNLIGTTGAFDLAKHLASNRTLTQVDLGENAIGPEGARALTSALQSNDTLTALTVDGDLSIPRLERRQLEVVVTLNSRPPMLKSALQRIRSGEQGPFLNLSAPDELRSHRGEIDPSRFLDCWSASRLAEALVGCRQVEVLKLSFQQIADEGARALSLMLERNEAIETLDLLGTAVTDVGAQYFAECLDENNTVRTINLKGTGVGETMLLELERKLVLNRLPLYFKKFLHRLMANDPEVGVLDLDEHSSGRQYDDIAARLTADALRVNTHLTALSFANNVITEVGAHFLADALCVNTTLKSLDLSRNPIGGQGAIHLAEALQESSALAVLKLAGCGIDDRGGDALATAAGHNESLTQLDVSDNIGICESGARFVRMMQSTNQLKDLDLSGTRVSSIVLRALKDCKALNQEPPALCSVAPRLHRGDPELTRVDLSRSQGEYPLSDSSASVLGQILADNFVLTDLNLANNEITDAGVEMLCAGLRHNKYTLRRLGLANNCDLSYESCRHLCSVLMTHQALTSIDLADNRILDAGASTLYDFLASEARSSQLLELNISGNHVDPELEHMVNVLVASHRCLAGLKQKLLSLFDGSFAGVEDLDLSELEAFVDPDTPVVVFNDTAEIIAMALETFDFRSLAYRWNRLGDEGLKYLCDLFRKNKSLTKLDVSHNRLTDEGVEYVIDMLQHRPEISDVVMDANKHVSAEALARLRYTLQFNTQPPFLKELLLDIHKDDPQMNTLRLPDTHHVITDGHLSYICESLGHNQYITALNLGHNHITIAGLSQLLSTLRGCPHIAEVCLRNNVLEGEEVGRVIRDFLVDPEHGSFVRSLDLSYNELDDGAAEHLLRALKQNDTLLTLQIQGNRISSKAAEDLQNAVSLNRQLELKRLLPRLRDNSDIIGAVNLPKRDLNNSSVQCLCEALSHNTVVKAIDLTGNPKITDVALINYLAPLVRRTATITEIDLSYTGITSEGAVAMLNALSDNTSLTVLDLTGNPLAPPHPLLCAYRSALQNNTTFLRLELDGTGLSKETICELECSNLNSQPVLLETLPKLEADDSSVSELCLSAAVTKAPNDTTTCRLLAQTLLHNTKLLKLDLSGSSQVDDRGVSLLAQTLEQNRALTDLSFASCNVTDEGCESIADMLKVNRTLTCIDLSYNHISTNGVSKLTKVLSTDGYGNDSIRNLNVEGNRDVSEAAVAALHYELLLNCGPLALKHDIPKIEAGSISMLGYREGSHGVKFNDDHVGILCDSLRGNSSVTVVDLAKNTIEWNGAEKLASMLRVNKGITSLNLSENLIGSGVSMLVDALAVNSSVLNLPFDGNGSEEYFGERLQELVVLNHHPLKLKKAILRSIDRDVLQVRVDVSGKDVAGEEIGHCTRLDDEGLALLCEHLKTDLVARAIDISWNAIKDDGAQALAAMLKYNPGIETVDLSHNFISDEGVEVLAEALSTHPAISDINLSTNTITAKGALALCKAVQHNPSIKKLSLDDNDGVPSEVYHRVKLMVTLNHRSSTFAALMHRLAEGEEVPEVNMEGWVGQGYYDGRSLGLVVQAVLMNTTVRSLNLSFCDVTDDQLTHIYTLLRGAPQLLSLNLSNNQLKNSIYPLTEAVAESKTLVSLELRDNNIQLPGAKLIAQMIRKNDCLKDLDLSGNAIGDVGIKIIAEAVKMNDSLQHVWADAKVGTHRCRRWSSLKTSCPAADFFCSVCSLLSTLGRQVVSERWEGQSHPSNTSAGAQTYHTTRCYVLGFARGATQ